MSCSDGEIQVAIAISEHGQILIGNWPFPDQDFMKP